MNGLLTDVENGPAANADVDECPRLYGDTIGERPE
jgi:hypothetical protein